MTYQKAAQIILNVWNTSQEWDAPRKEQIEGTTKFDIAMRMAYDILMEKSKEKNKK